MPVLGLSDDPSSFHSIRQQTAFNLVLIKHTAHYYTTIFYGAIFFIWTVPTSLKEKSCFTRAQVISGKEQSISLPVIQWIDGTRSICLFVCFVLFALKISLSDKQIMWQPSLRLYMSLQCLLWYSIAVILTMLNFNGNILIINRWGKDFIADVLILVHHGVFFFFLHFVSFTKTFQNGQFSSV